MQVLHFVQSHRVMSSQTLVTCLHPGDVDSIEQTLDPYVSSVSSFLSDSRVRKCIQFQKSIFFFMNVFKVYLQLSSSAGMETERHITSIFLSPSCMRRNVSSVFLLNINLYTCVREIHFRISAEIRTATVEVFCGCWNLSRQMFSPKLLRS